MADTVAIAAISGGSAVLGGAMGAGAAYLTALRTQRAQADEDHFRHRQGVYHDFLLSVAEFRNASLQRQNFSADKWDAWYQSLELRRAAINLFASSAVIAQANRVTGAMEEAIEAIDDAPPGTLGDRRQNAFEEHLDDFADASNGLMEGMRKDVWAS